MTAHGAFHWNELMTRDVAKAKAFYEQTLGWTFEDMPMPGMDGNYTLIKSNGELVAGMFPMSGPDFENMPDHWFAYVAVDDVDKRIDLLKAAGGKVHRDPFDVPGTGRIAIIEIPGGAMQGWMTPAEGAG